MTDENSEGCTFRRPTQREREVNINVQLPFRVATEPEEVEDGQPVCEFCGERITDLGQKCPALRTGGCQV